MCFAFAFFEVLILREECPSQTPTSFMIIVLYIFERKKHSSLRGRDLRNCRLTKARAALSKTSCEEYIFSSEITQLTE